MNRFLHRCLTRTPIVAVLMSVLLFRALIPAGFMPVQAESGLILMQLCSGIATHPVRVDLGEDNAGQAPGIQPSDHSPCGFASASLTTPPPPATVLAEPSDPGFRGDIEGARSVIAASIARIQSPRGPPLI